MNDDDMPSAVPESGVFRTPCLPLKYFYITSNVRYKPKPNISGGV